MLDELRLRIREAARLDEAAVVHMRIAEAALTGAERAAIADRANRLVVVLRARRDPSRMESLLAEYGLSDDEGLALMCLAEAYLRVPDTGSIDALIRDKIGAGDWTRHAGSARSMLVNASTWGLMLSSEIFRDRRTSHANALAIVHDLKHRLGEPVVRAGVGAAMRAMGQQFVLGRDIDEAISRSRKGRAHGYRHSYDMLGEAARTAGAAQRYRDAYAHAIDRLSKEARARASVFDNPGISVKLSALHPRYEASQKDRVMRELVPRVVALARDARDANIGFNIDAEEANRLDLSLDVIEAALRDPALRGWEGFGIVVQAYAKTCVPVLAWFAALVRDIGCRAAVRLVKGAYWDTEIKHAQVLGLANYPVFTRKAATDASYLAAARFLLAHDDLLYPQFATHNAHTVAAILELATGHDRFEFQRLHGMGESLHQRVVEETGRICRIYAPVGAHEDLLAYLVRRMLENGANSSFVNQLLDESIAPEVLVADPVAALQRATSIANPLIALPPSLFGASRRNSIGVDVNEAADAAALDASIAPFLRAQWHAAPLPAADAAHAGAGRPVPNPAEPGDIVGWVRETDPDALDAIVARTRAVLPAWRAVPAEHRAALLDAVAQAFEVHRGELIALLTREAGKIRVDAVAEVREAVDFCRYYAARMRREAAGESDAAADDAGRHAPAGLFVCISPWNFPLAIFTGQVVAALVCGNVVVAKPADQTPLVAARAVSLVHAAMRDAGLPAEALALAPGPGATIGAALVARPDVDGVCFTGSGATACRIDRAMARANPHARLVAETGGINAMVVDSTALPEAAVRDIVQSAFQSAGQRCSALRVLFVQQDIADELIAMLAGAAAELRVGDPRSPGVDVGPVIDEAAQARIVAHCETFRRRGRVLFGGEDLQRLATAGRLEIPAAGDDPDRLAVLSTRFVAPVGIALERLSEVDGEIFGPVLHVIRFAAGDLDGVIDQINASGYGLTFGLHSRIDDRVHRFSRRIRAGNLYVNRNQIGAVVGVQPFGGEGLSGTGPKAGGPFYLSAFRLATDTPAPVDGARTRAASVDRDAVGPRAAGKTNVALPQLDAGGIAAIAQAVHSAGVDERVARLRLAIADGTSPWRDAALHAFDLGARLLQGDPLPGPTGESNHLRHAPRGVALCLGQGPDPAAALLLQSVKAMALGNAVIMAEGTATDAAAGLLGPALRDAGLPPEWLATVPMSGTAADLVQAATRTGDVSMVCVEPGEGWPAVRRALADRDGARVTLLRSADSVDRFGVERVVTVDTTASGGNANLLSSAGAADLLLKAGA